LADQLRLPLKNFSRPGDLSPGRVGIADLPLRAHRRFEFVRTIGAIALNLIVSCAFGCKRSGT
jgi:hypothetical protein